MCINLRKQVLNVLFPPEVCLSHGTNETLMDVTPTPDLLRIPIGEMALAVLLFSWDVPAIRHACVRYLRGWLKAGYLWQ